MGEIIITRGSALKTIQIYTNLVAIISAEGKDVSEILPLVEFRRAVKKLKKVNEEDYEDRVHEIRLRHCQRDPKTLAVIKDSEGNFSYQADGYAALCQDMKSLNNETIVVRVDPVDSWATIVSHLPEKIRADFPWEDVEEYLTGIVNP